jgi:hypothetical protein
MMLPCHKHAWSIFPAISDRPLKLKSDSSFSLFASVEGLSPLEQKDAKETKKSCKDFRDSLPHAQLFPRSTPAG